jgi:hypothetical protein
MKKKRKTIFCVLLMIFISFALSTTAFAIPESEVQAHVAAHGREAVTGNIFIWFLCAVAFLKISQKIDSFMASLGINVGNTGGSMMAELIIASRGVAAGKHIFGGSSGGFLSGGLAGVVSRSFNRGAVVNATSGEGGGIGGAVFASSMNRGGDYANNVISSVAQGNINTIGMMTGEKAVTAFNSYMGYTAEAQALADAAVGTNNTIPSFSNVEIGGGRMMGTEISVDNPNGIRFGMYSTDQYMAPENRYDTVSAADGSQWYRQYACDAVERTPYMAPDGSIAYNESIIQKLPDMPRRKDRV